jgi:glycolate oxidase FAD binding subunit
MMSASETATLRPRDAEDLIEIVTSHPRALEPVAGGSKRTVGKPVEADLLELTAFAGIRAYEPAELVLTAGAATPLSVVQNALASSAQRLAFEPPDLGALLGERAPQSLGGVLAANLAGSRRVSAGAARDHFLGCTAVNGRGEKFVAGGRVVKNVTGYDLPKLLAGSWGTLAVLMDVTVRVMPAAETERTLVVRARDAAEAVAAMSAALGSPHEVSAAAFDPERGVTLRLEGFSASVAARADALCGALPVDGVLDGADSRSVWDEIGGATALAEWPVVWRISVPPSDAPRVLAALAPERYLLDWGGGLIFAAFRRTDAARVRAALQGGHATLLKAPLADRRANDVFQPLPGVLSAAALRLKQAFDPNDRLNPGRLG